MLITRKTLKEMLEKADAEKRQHIVGRALVALFFRQTDAEKETNDTKVLNSVGFSGADAKSGSLTAKFYLKNRRLEPWQMERWMKPLRNGYPKITKYYKQLNEVAERKAATKVQPTV